jgi:hypothetical protein
MYLDQVDAQRKVRNDANFRYLTRSNIANFWQELYEDLFSLYMELTK